MPLEKFHANRRHGLLLERNKLLHSLCETKGLNLRDARSAERGQTQTSERKKDLCAVMQ